MSLLSFLRSLRHYPSTTRRTNIYPTLLESEMAVIERQHATVCDALDQALQRGNDYADLLNALDGGQRLRFDGAEEWISWLIEERRLPR